jgi:NADPH-dependent ferric siderophore reductase
VTVQDIGDFKVGEGRALTTSAGNYAFLRREDGRFALEVAGERFELQDFASAEPGLPGELAIAHEDEGKHVVIKRVDKTEKVDAEGAKRHRIVKIVDADGSEHEALAMALARAEAGDDEAFAFADGEGPRVMVTRRVTKEAAAEQ